MDTLTRSLVEKAGYDYGFEYTVSQDGCSLVLGSARHEITVGIKKTVSGQYLATLINAREGVLAELMRSFDSKQGSFYFDSLSLLAALLQRVSALAISLPNKAEDDFHRALSEELKKFPEGIQNTEVERIIRQRIGQGTYRSAMLKYWDGACAVTGVCLTSVLKASHALPWAECKSDSERMDVYNGFLLTANLDALFDRFLISFDSDGQIIISDKISNADRKNLGLDSSLRLRWITQSHETYLEQHRNRVLAP